MKRAYAKRYSAPSKTAPISPRLTGSQTSIARHSVSAAPLISASSRTRAMRKGETAASTSTSTRHLFARSSSNTASRPKRTPPAAPPARAGFAKYMESIVPALAGL